MGFFERFRKRVQEVADVTDLDELTAEEGTEEAQEALTPSSPDVVEDEWVAVEVGSATDTKTWVKLNRKNMKTLKEGDRVIFYVKVESGEE